jgi:AraC-like DNA-binding protein
VQKCRGFVLKDQFMPSGAFPLASHCQFASSDFEAMHHHLSAVLKPHRLRRLSNVPVSGIICRANLKRVSLNFMRIGPAVDVAPGALEHFFLVQVPIQGTVQINLGSERIRCEGNTAAVISPGERLSLQWSDNCAQLILQIPRDTMQARLTERLGVRRRAALKFQPAFDIGGAAGREWRRLLDLAVRAVDEDGILARDPLCADLENLLVSALLAAQPHTYSEEWRNERFGAAPYYVLRAERKMREQLALPLGVAQLADAAGVSERTLYEGFRRFRATTPIGRLTALRLTAARERMLAAEPGMTVARVAAEVGFSQFGRFARTYRDTFGELPSQTLRSARRRTS